MLKFNLSLTVLGLSTDFAYESLFEIALRITAIVELALSYSPARVKLKLIIRIE